ncbi:uncharacterized protein MONBRDRAFT_5866 [Monosiga brevicollis MX1]|uniref:RAVE complex protein Rav1 C-terminal domain-containing protein n=1 Tax=Monosiga brevicollis TaxID=81824 RepID=A9USQ2_MONBE|nr:uncharacterized protein MONBRDRAFT_5866 [Monosiga brevicollis MX1]EDQ91819.1 predicted protein [Monosiga brevicollis MX1]|eukprot:XP_001743105.1 hypothetical protein [Monosiga brevicollis MX1]
MAASTSASEAGTALPSTTSGSCRASRPIGITLHHNSGVLAHWRVHFELDSAFSSVVAVDCVARCVGHTRPINVIKAHRQLGCAISMAVSDDEAELLVWKANDSPVIPTTHRGDQSVTQLARIKLPVSDMETRHLQQSMAFFETERFVAWAVAVDKTVHMFGLGAARLADRSASAQETMAQGGLISRMALAPKRLLKLTSDEPIQALCLVRLNTSTERERHAILLFGTTTTQMALLDAEGEMLSPDALVAHPVPLVLPSIQATALTMVPNLKWTPDADVSSITLDSCGVTSAALEASVSQLQAHFVLATSSGLQLWCVEDDEQSVQATELLRVPLTLLPLNQVQMDVDVSRLGRAVITARTSAVTGSSATEVAVVDLLSLTNGQEPAVSRLPSELAVRHVTWCCLETEAELLQVCCDDFLYLQCLDASGDFRVLAKQSHASLPQQAAMMQGGVCMMATENGMDVFSKWDEPLLAAIRDTEAFPAVFLRLRTTPDLGGAKPSFHPATLRQLVLHNQVDAAMDVLQQLWTSVRPFRISKETAELEQNSFFTSTLDDYRFELDGVKEKQHAIAWPWLPLARYADRMEAQPTKTGPRQRLMTKESLLTAHADTAGGDEELSLAGVDRLQRALSCVSDTFMVGKQLDELGAMARVVLRLNGVAQDLDEAGQLFRACWELAVPTAATTEASQSVDALGAFIGVVSDAEDTLLALVDQFDVMQQRWRPAGDPDLRWADFRAAGAGYWVRSKAKLQAVIERIAKATFQATNDPLEAAIFYVVLRKAKLLAGLFKLKNNERMATFFNNNFAEERWQTAALKNAFVLVSKHRFQEAVAFFLLGRDVASALNICLRNLNDPQLAFVVARLMYDDETAISSFATDSLAQHLSEHGAHLAGRALALWLGRSYCESFDELTRVTQRFANPDLALRLALRLEQHSQLRGKRRVPTNLYQQAASSLAAGGHHIFAALVCQELLQRLEEEEANSIAAPDGEVSTAVTDSSGAATSQQDLINSGTFSFDAFGGFGFDDFPPEPEPEPVGPATDTAHADTDESSLEKLLSALIPLARCITVRRLRHALAVHVASDLGQLSQLHMPWSAALRKTAAGAALCFPTASLDVPVQPGTVPWLALNLATNAFDLSAAGSLLAACKPSQLVRQMERVSRELLNCAQSFLVTRSGQSEEEPGATAPASADLNTLSHKLSASLSRSLRKVAIDPEGLPLPVSPESLAEQVLAVYVARVALHWRERNLPALQSTFARFHPTKIWTILFGAESESCLLAAQRLAAGKHAAELQDTVELLCLLENEGASEDALPPGFTREAVLNSLDALADVEETEEGRESDSVPQDAAYRYRWALLELTILRTVCRQIDCVLESAGLATSELSWTSPALYRLVMRLSRHVDVLRTEYDALATPDVSLAGSLGDSAPSNDGANLTATTRSIFKMKALVEPRNNPFKGVNARRLWHTLINAPLVLELVQGDLLDKSTTSVGPIVDQLPLADWYTMGTVHHEVVDMIATLRSSNTRLALGTTRDILEIDTDASLRQEGLKVTLERPVPNTRRLCGHPRHEMYVSAGTDDQLVLWEYDSPQPQGLYQRKSSNSSVSHTAFDLFGCRLGQAQSDGTVHLWHFAQQSRGTPFRELSSGLKRLEYFEFLSASILALGGHPQEHHSVEVWDTLLPPRQSVVQRFHVTDATATSLLYLPEKLQLLCGTSKGDVALLDIRTQSIVKTMPMHDGSVQKMLLCEDGHHVTTTGLDGAVRLWDARTGTERCRWDQVHGTRGRMFSERASDLALVGSLLYSVGPDGSLRCINLRNFV